MDRTFHDTSILLIKDALDSLLQILLKVESTPVADTIADARIHETMLPFSFQIHWTTTVIDKVIADATGGETSGYTNNLTSLPAMIQRVKEVQAKFATAERDIVNGRQHEAVAFPLGPKRPVVQTPLWQYVQGNAIPNIFFHISTAYNIARKEGVDLGKVDYLWSFASQYYEPQLAKLEDKA